MTAARSIPERILYYAELWTGGMFLQDEAFVYMRERRNPFASGLLYVVLLGVIVALANILGAVASYATSPSLDAVKNTVFVHLQAMPFYEQMVPQTQRAFDSGFNQFWDVFGPVFAQYPDSPQQIAQLLMSVLTIPLGLVIGWLIYGGLAHVIARKWNPEISFAEMLAPLSLAVSPQLLNVLNVFPNVNVSYAVTALWFFVCALTAIRVTYHTTARNAMRAALFPILVGLVAVILLVVLVLILVVTRGGQ
jgi:hypothetical protein